MRNLFSPCTLVVALASWASACASDNGSTDPMVVTGDAGGGNVNTTPADAGGSTTLHDAGTSSSSDAATTPSQDGGLPVQDAATHSSDAATNDASVTSHDAGAHDASTTDGGGGNSLTGSLGALGTIQPIVTAKVISNSGETLIYMTTAPLTCDVLTTSRWLGGFTKDAQVVELVIKGAPQVGTPVQVGPFGGEVNYAAGGKSSAYEVNAQSGTITYTKSEPMGVVEGTVTATYAMGSVMGMFHAEFCAGGQGY